MRNYSYDVIVESETARYTQAGVNFSASTDPARVTHCPACGAMSLKMVNTLSARIQGPPVAGAEARLKHSAPYPRHDMVFAECCRQTCRWRYHED